MRLFLALLMCLCAVSLAFAQDELQYQSVYDLVKWARDDWYKREVPIQPAIFEKANAEWRVHRIKEWCKGSSHWAAYEFRYGPTWKSLSLKVRLAIEIKAIKAWEQSERSGDLKKIDCSLVK